MTTDDTLTVPAAPAIPGLRFRRFRGHADFAPMVAVIMASVEADKLERAQTPEEMERAYSHLTNCDPATDMLMAEVNGELVAYGRVEWTQLDSGERTYTALGYVRPDVRRRGLGRAMLHHQQARLRAIAADHPAGPRFYEGRASDTEPAAEALMLSEGYTAERHFFNMVRPTLTEVPDLPLPPGLEVRPVLPEQHAAIFAALDEAFRDHWGAKPLTPEMIAGFTGSPYFKPELWQVAWDVASGEVAGFVMNFINTRENEKYGRQRGYTDPIGVRRPWRKQGLARALIARSLLTLRHQGMTEAGLTVDTNNPSGALRLYEGLGYQQVKRTTIYRKPMETLAA